MCPTRTTAARAVSTRCSTSSTTRASASSTRLPVISLAGARRVGGGDINDAYEVRLDDGRRAFVKTRADAAPGEYQTEAAGLRWLAEANAVAVPEVIEATDAHLALEWIESGGRYDEEALGRGLAELHRSGAAGFGARAPGAPGPLRIGPLPFALDTADAWPEHYAAMLLVLVPDAGLSAAGRRAVESVCERMADFAGPPEPPARLHGDLWSG